MVKIEIDYDRLIELLIYNPKNGLFIRRISRPGYRKDTISGCKDSKGYIVIGLDGKVYKAHRLAFLYMNEYLPKNDIHHKDGDKSNNKWDNLEHLARSQHRKTINILKNNTSGVVGVTYIKNRGAWCVRVNYIKKRIYIGYYKNFIDAVKARWDAEKRYNYPNCQTTSSAYLYLKGNNLL